MTRFRKRKLINTGVQLRLTLWFVGATAVAMLLLFVVFSAEIRNMSPYFGDERAAQLLTATFMRTFLAALGLGLSITLITGVLVTHRICGPLYRFTQFLGAVEKGEHPGECKIRKNDELHDMCELLNRVTAPIRAGQSQEPSTGDADASSESEPESDKVAA